MTGTTGPRTIPAALIRGGTSKGVFLHRRDLPDFGPELDALLLNIMGTPDPMQIDGLGGTYSSTSKVIIVAPGDRPGIDVRYWFAQIGIDEPIVDWSGNCGNLTMAVGPFAIDEGLVPGVEPVTELHLFNENTAVEIIAKVPVEGGRSKEAGDLFISGVPNPGAPIVTEFLEPGGAVYGHTLPTGSPLDTISGPDGDIDVSIVDVTHPNAFVRGADFGLSVVGADPRLLNGDEALLARVEDLRVRVAARIRQTTGSDKQAPTLPRLVFLASPDEGGAADHEAGICALGVSLGKFHHASPMTSALCLGGATAIPGTVANKLAQTQAGTGVGIRHPKGVVVVTASVEESPTGPEVRTVGVIRTARRLMAGDVYVRQSG